MSERRQRSSASLRRRASGFTLVELMVALTVGGIAITSIYAIGSASTRQFFQQHQLASAQTSLRMAINQLKRDISRAGFHATPRADLPGQSCATPSAALDDPAGSGRLAAFSNFQNNLVLSATPTTGNPTGNAALDPTGSNRQYGFTTDDIVLFGNYETASEYPGVTLDLANTDIVNISSGWYSFQRDFTDWYASATVAIDAPALNRAFAPNRLVRLRTPSGASHFGQILRVAPGNIAGSIDTTIQLTAAVPGACVPLMVNGWIAPVDAIRYYARTAPTAEGELTADTTGPMAQLVREEVLPTDKRTPLTVNNLSNTRVILDYLVGFNLAFTISNQTTPGQPDQYVPGDLRPDATAANPAVDVAALNANPERIRAVMIDLAARTPEQDPTFPWGANCANLRCFQVFPATGTGARVGAARVRRIRAEVFVPNVAFEGF